MRRLLALLLGGLGLGAVARRRRESPAVETGPDPAEELRARLAESKAAAVAEPEPVAETPVPGEPLLLGELEPSPLDPQERRRSVYERARGAIDELQ